MPTRFSHSRLATFGKCPRQYRYRYVDRLPRPGPGIEAHMGISVHQALEFLYRQLQAGGEIPDLDSVLAAYEEAWSSVAADELRIARRGFDVGDYHALGQHCLEGYYRQFHPFRDGCILAVEKKVSFALRGRRAAKEEFPMVGYIDALIRADDGVVEIHDYKTSGSLPRPVDLDRDEQLSLYEIGVRKEMGLDETERVRQVWHYLTFGRTEMRERTREDLLAVGRRTVAAIRRVMAADTFPARTGILCHWCDFRDHCPEGRDWLADQEPPGLPAAGG